MLIAQEKNSFFLIYNINMIFWTFKRINMGWNYHVNDNNNDDNDCHNNDNSHDSNGDDKNNNHCII